MMIPTVIKVAVTLLASGFIGLLSTLITATLNNWYGDIVHRVIGFFAAVLGSGFVTFVGYGLYCLWT